MLQHVDVNLKNVSSFISAKGKAVLVIEPQQEFELFEEKDLDILKIVNQESLRLLYFENGTAIFEGHSKLKEINYRYLDVSNNEYNSNGYYLANSSEVEARNLIQRNFVSKSKLVSAFDIKKLKSMENEIYFLALFFHPKIRKILIPINKSKTIIEFPFAVKAE